MSIRVRVSLFCEDRIFIKTVIRVLKENEENYLNLAYSIQLQTHRHRLDIFLHVDMLHVACRFDKIHVAVYKDPYH